MPAGGELFANFSAAIKAGAEDHGLEYLSAQANGDSSAQFKQTQQILTRGVGALGIVDLAPPGLAPLQQQAIAKGIAVVAGSYPPATCQLAEDVYGIGEAAGHEAVKWIRENLDGQAQVVIFNADETPALIPRARGIKAALKAGGPGITVVADVASPLSEKDSFDVAQTLLKKNPGANVWIGKDTALAGVIAAIESAGKSTAEVGLFGIDGDAGALAAIEEGGPYKATIGSAYPVLGYAWAKYAADWLEGKNIPLVIETTAVVLTKEDIAPFKAANASPKQAFLSNDKKGYPYFKPIANTSYEENQYLRVVANEVLAS